MAGPVVTELRQEFTRTEQSQRRARLRFDWRKPNAGAGEMLRQRQYRRDRGRPTSRRFATNETRGLLSAARPPLRVKYVRLLVDDPNKIGSKTTGTEASAVLSGLMQVIESAQSELLIISPYFVPGAGGAEALINLVKRGLRVAVLTNSLAATDVAAVHTGYAECVAHCWRAASSCTK
jgi:putative cardiolipin synthase